MDYLSTGAKQVAIVESRPFGEVAISGDQTALHC